MATLIISCYTTKSSILGHYSSNCRQIDFINIHNDSTYTIKYSLGSICDGKLKIIGDTLFLMDDWKQENLRKGDSLFNKNNDSFLDRDVEDQLNRAIIQINKPIRFVIRKNKLIGIDTAQYNYNYNCIFKRVR